MYKNLSLSPEIKPKQMQTNTYPVTAIAQGLSRALVNSFRGITLEEFLWSKSNIYNSILQVISLLDTDGKIDFVTGYDEHHRKTNMGYRTITAHPLFQFIKEVLTVYDWKW